MIWLGLMYGLRGLKVGDNIKKVESIYGKPDVGFSGDSKVSTNSVSKQKRANIE